MEAPRSTLKRLASRLLQFQISDQLLLRRRGVCWEIPRPFGDGGSLIRTSFRLFVPGSIAKGSSSKSGCQLHLPTSHANLSRVTSPANFSCQLVESYFTCQLLMPTCRELLHLPTSHVNFLRVTSPANFSCQLFGCYLILLKAQANLSGVTSLS